VAFELTSHEVMRGLKLRDERLVIRVSGGAMVWSVVRMAFGSVWVSISLQGGGGFLFPLIGVAIVAEAALWLRCRVVVRPDRLEVTNPLRRHDLDLADVVGVVVAVETRWLVPEPRFGVSWFPKYEVGEVVCGHRDRISVAALIGSPDTSTSALSPVQMKVAALNRYLESLT
jgi:hypothetical protein